MTKFVIRDQSSEPPEPTITLFLTVEGSTVFLVGIDGSGNRKTILAIKAGGIERYPSAKLAGLATEADGRVMLADYD